MHEEYARFFKVLGQVSLYSFDRAPTTPSEDTEQRPFNISTDEFLKELYEERSVEDVIRQKLLAGGEVICLVGPRGSGKSSIALNMTKDFGDRSWFVTLVDIRMEKILEALDAHDTKTVAEYLKRRVSAEYDSRLFNDDDRQEPNPRLRLFEYLLKPAEKDEKPLTIFYGLQEFENRAIRLFRKWRGVDESDRNDATYYRWLKETHYREPYVEQLLVELEKKIQLPHLVYAARHVMGKRRHLIWLDNVDSIPDTLQLEALDVLKGFLRTTATYARCVISIREENVFKEDNLSDEGGPPFDTRVMLEVVASRDGNVVYPAVDVPLIRMDTLGSIFRKRLTHAKKYQSETVEVIRNRIRERQRSLYECRDEDKAQIIRNEMKLDEDELQSLLPIISNSRFGYLIQLSQMIVRVMAEERAVYLANNAVRDLLYLHRDFLRFLRNSPDPLSEPPEALTYRHWYLATLFLTWLRRTQRRYQVGMYDLIADCQLWHQRQHGKVGCLLPHLVLTAVWNLHRKKMGDNERKFTSITVGEIVELLERIGYSRDEIVEAMFSLSYGRGFRGNFLEFRVGLNGKDLTHSCQVQNGHLLRITYRGKAMVAYVGSSFGYLHECMRAWLNPHQDHTVHHQLTSTSDLVENMLPYLCDVAQMHYTAFCGMVAGGRLGVGKAALTNYLDRFGVPQISPYARQMKVGTKIGNVYMAFQFESIMASLLSYMPSTNDTTKKLMRLRDLFVGVMEEPGKDDSINFRRELGYQDWSE